MRAAAFVLGAWAAAAAAEEPAKGAPRITGMAPAALAAGRPATLRIRGFGLKDATTFRFVKLPNVKATLKEKGGADAVPGFENSLIGDSQALVEFALPADLSPGKYEFVVATPAGIATGGVAVLPSETLFDEKEPNNGFRSAQKIPAGKAVRGAISADRDVDVYELSLAANKRHAIVVQGGHPMVLDATLSCYDSRGQFLGYADDGPGTRDPSLTLSAPSDGTVFVCVGSAHGKGGKWHTYLLSAEASK